LSGEYYGRGVLMAKNLSSIFKNERKLPLIKGPRMFSGWGMLLIILENTVNIPLNLPLLGETCEFLFQNRTYSRRITIRIPFQIWLIKMIKP